MQEHSIEDLDGHGLRERHLPHRLVARNSCGEEVSIVAVIKTQGSDTKLVGQMQPFYEAQTLQRRDVAGVSPFASEILSLMPKRLASLRATATRCPQ